MAMRRLIAEPPSGITGPMRDYLSEIARVLNNRPVISYFSGTDPNSNVTGVAGDLVFNVGSASTSTRWWGLGGEPSTVTNQGWVKVQVLA